MAKIVTIVGARPQFVKAGAVSREIAAAGNLEEVLVHTGQHFDEAMSAVFFRELELREPAYNLGIASKSHGAMTGQMIEAIESVLVSEQPELVLVYGDTNSTVAGALAAVKLHIPVGHVEAGLRSFNRKMPEEINRVVTDHVASIQFCPTVNSVENLRREGVVDRVYQTGDVMFDATKFAITASEGRPDVLDKLGLAPGSYAIATLHRAENTDDAESLRKVCAYLARVAESTRLIIPLHPRTRQALQRSGIKLDPAIIVDPLGYFDFHALIARSDAVYTDSGGLQKEAYFHGKPCVTLRDETEWTETIEHGWNRLWRDPDYVTPRRPIGDYGDGHAARAIVDRLTEFLA